MFKRSMLAASLAVAGLCSAQAMAAVVGGGATLPASLYASSGFFPSSFTSYVGVGSGNGKAAFFGNDSTKINLAAGITVDYAGSDSRVTAAELAGYNAAAYGPLIQIPVAATSVALPYRIDGQTSALVLTAPQIAQIFAGQVTNWNQVGGPNLAIKVVYRNESSGTTEIFSTHLRTVAAASVPAISSTFATAVGFNPLSAAPAGSTYIPVTGSGGVATAVANNNGAIGYVGPDYAAVNDPLKVVTVQRTVGGSTVNYLPTEVNVTATLESVTPPTGSSDPLAWVPSFTNPTAGYPFVGYTNLIISQCYNAVDSVGVRTFLNNHYTGANAARVAAASLIPVPATWQTAIHNTFWNTGSSLRVGDLNACSGKGRPQ